MSLSLIDRALIVVFWLWIQDKPIIMRVSDEGLCYKTLLKTPMNGWLWVYSQDSQSACLSLILRLIKCYNKLAPESEVSVAGHNSMGGGYKTLLYSNIRLRNSQSACFGISVWFYSLGLWLEQECLITVTDRDYNFFIMLIDSDSGKLINALNIWSWV